MEKESLAMEMLKELKHQSKRWFIIAIIELIIIIATNTGWLIYEAQFEVAGETETTTVDAGDNGNATYLENSKSGDINYGENN